MAKLALADLGISLPVLAAPMAGGPSTPELVVGAAEVGALGFVAGGYRSATALAEQLSAVRSRTSIVGVNLFAPNPVPVDPSEYARYRAAIRAEAERLGAGLPAQPIEDDDRWSDKLDLLVQDPVPLVSFTFAIPPASALTALRRAGSLLAQTVTSVEEAERATHAGVDLLILQGANAGGHFGTFTPHRPVPARPLTTLLGDIAALGRPVIATGGLSDAGAVGSAIQAGALAVMVGTALLLAPESGTSSVHRQALLGPDRGDTVVTRAFTGRPARALPNDFLRHHDAEAPLGYPALHHLTSPLRKAAAAAGDPEHVHLWAGTGYRTITARPAGQILTDLAAGL